MILGIDQLKHRLTRIHDGLGFEMGIALYEEAKIDLTEAIKRTPEKTGELKRSGKLGEILIRAKTVAVDISFGGDTAPYAVYVHEDFAAFHPKGQAKFLESVLLESAPFMAERLARRIDLAKL